MEGQSEFFQWMARAVWKMGWERGTGQPAIRREDNPGWGDVSHSPCWSSVCFSSKTSEKPHFKTYILGQDARVKATIKSTYLLLNNKKEKINLHWNKEIVPKPKIRNVPAKYCVNWVLLISWSRIITSPNTNQVGVWIRRYDLGGPGHIPEMCQGALGRL